VQVSFSGSVNDEHTPPPPHTHTHTDTHTLSRLRFSLCRPPAKPYQLSTWCFGPDMQAVPEMRQAQLAATSLFGVGYAVNADHGAGCKLVHFFALFVLSGRADHACLLFTRTSSCHLQHTSSCEAVLCGSPREVSPRGQLRPACRLEVALVRVCGCRRGSSKHRINYSQRRSPLRARAPGANVNLTFFFELTRVAWVLHFSALNGRHQPMTVL
jgi:hypothetical protein